jgi:hypothetical protein
MLKLSPVERAGAISRRAFLDDYRRPRRPVVLEELTASWPARRKWSVDYLKSVAGDREIPVYGSRPARGRTHQHAAVARMPLREFLERLQGGDNALRIFFLRVTSALPELVPDFSYPDIGVRYMKQLSVLFAAGRHGRVQMHFDVDYPDLFLCHFGGRKRVVLFAPEQTPYLYRVPFSFSAPFDLAPEAPDYDRFPALARAQGQIAELGHGDALYIPPGYWHYALYDDVGFSLSLRTLPGTARDLLATLRNIVVVRTIDGLMRKTLGQRWNDRNEHLAVRRVHRRLGLAQSRRPHPAA